MAALIQGTTIDYNKISDVPVDKGRYFTQQEVDVARNVAIIGSDVADNLYPGQEPVGKTFKINGLNFTVIGVQTPKGRKHYQRRRQPRHKMHHSVWGFCQNVSLHATQHQHRH